MNIRLFKSMLAAFALSALLLPGLASALPITKTLTLNVYQVCQTDGSNCASTGPVGDTFFEVATNKIWAQAGISVGFSFAGQILNSLFTQIDDGVEGRRFSDIAASTGNFQSSTVVDMFLVHRVNGGDAYGEAWQDAGGLVMGMDDIMSFGTGGRIDTMAHELGHNLGLVPTTDPQYAGTGDPSHSNDGNQLMASGAIRQVPSTLADINPSGLGYDQLSAFQIDVARQSSLLSPVPEPEGYALLLAGLAFVTCLSRRSRQR